MSGTAQALLVVTRLISAVNAVITLAGNSQKYRDLIAKAIAENRDLSDDELLQLRKDAQGAIDRL